MTDAARVRSIRAGSSGTVRGEASIDELAAAAGKPPTDAGVNLRTSSLHLLNPSIHSSRQCGQL
jgi:hypothetical protein